MSTSSSRWRIVWRELAEKPKSVEAVESTVHRCSIPAFSFYFMLAISAVIVFLGLLANSAAVVIGAMIIAPLMSPIFAISYGLVSGTGPLIFRSLLTVVTGTLLTIGQVYRHLNGISRSVLPAGFSFQMTNLSVRIGPDVISVRGDIVVPPGIPARPDYPKQCQCHTGPATRCGSTAGRSRVWYRSRNGFTHHVKENPMNRFIPAPVLVAALCFWQPTCAKETFQFFQQKYFTQLLGSVA